jgi:hypothetical protein
MKDRTRRPGIGVLGIRAAAILMAGALVAGCTASSAGDVQAEPAVVVEEIPGSDLERLTLSPRAAERLGIETVPVAEEEVAGEPRLIVPYSAVLYAADGSAWVYTNPEGRSFVRHEITIESIAGDLVILTDGPALGTLVATVGVSELHGVEAGVGGGH